MTSNQERVNTSTNPSSVPLPTSEGVGLVVEMIHRWNGLGLKMMMLETDLMYVCTFTAMKDIARADRSLKRLGIW